MATQPPLAHSHALLGSFNDFLTVAIHNLLYHRGLYPPETFLSARAFNLPVHQNRHPRVIGWVRDAVAAVAAQLASARARHVAFVVHASLDRDDLGPGSSVDSDAATTTSIAPGAVLERWMFDVSNFPAWPGGASAQRDFGTMLQRAARTEEDARPPGAGDVNFADVDEQLRAAVRKLAHAAEGMASLPPGCTFTVVVELREHEDAPIGHPQDWMASEPNLQPATHRRPGSQAGADLGGVKTTPVRSVQAGPLFFECWVEEGKAKEALRG